MQGINVSMASYRYRLHVCHRVSIHHQRLECFLKLQFYMYWIQLHLQQSYCTLKLLDFFSRCDLTSYLGLCTNLTITFFSSGLCLDSQGSFTPVLAPYDPFGVDVPLNFGITHSLNYNMYMQTPNTDLFEPTRQAIQHTQTPEPKVPTPGDIVIKQFCKMLLNSSQKCIRSRGLWRNRTILPQTVQTLYSTPVRNIFDHMSNGNISPLKEAYVSNSNFILEVSQIKSAVFSDNPFIIDRRTSSMMTGMRVDGGVIQSHCP